MHRKLSFIEEEMNRVFNGPEDPHVVVPDISVPTGILSLDLCLGGGLPTGLTEIYGEESTGKTALVGHIIASAQQNDMETMLCSSALYDSLYMKKLGVDESNLVLVRARYIEVLLDVVLMFLSSSRLKGKRRLIAIDDMSGFRPIDSVTFDEWNRMMYQAMEEFSSMIPIGSVVVIVNQARAHKISDNRYKGTESAARWVGDLFDVRLELSRKDVHHSDYTLIANIVQSRVGRPHRWIEVPCRKGRGVDIWRDCVRTGTRCGWLERKGNFYYLNGESLGHGEVEAARTLANDPNMSYLLFHGHGQ